MSNNVVDILKGVVGELREIARSETIIGEPVTVGNRTVIPVVRIIVGFGAGGGQGEDDKSRTGFGGGGGGGTRIEPSAFIIIDDTGVSLLPMHRGKIDQIIDAIPGFAQNFNKFKENWKKSRASSTESDEDLGDELAEEE